MAFRPSRRASSITASSSAPGFSHTSPMPLRFKIGQHGEGHVGRQVHGGHVDWTGDVHDRSIGALALDFRGVGMDGHDGVARRAEGPHGLVPELVPAARCADHGDHSSHNFTIPRALQCRPVRRPLLTLLALAALTFTTGLGRQAITDADEAYYAEASREMLASNDWLTPRFNFADRWQKPVLYYWMTAGAYTVAGVTEGAARFGAAMAGLGLALITWWVARRLHSSADAAWLAGAIVGHFFRLFRHGALGAARLAAGPVHHGHDRHRAARRRPWSRRDALVDPGRHGRRLRLPDEGTGRGRRSRGGATAGLVAGACNRAPIVAGHPRGHGHERIGRVAMVRRDVRRARAPVSGQLLPDRQPRTVHHLPLQRTAAAVVLSGGDRRRPAALDAVCDRSCRRGAGRRGETAAAAVPREPPAVDLGGGADAVVHGVGGPATALRTARAAAAGDPARGGYRSASGRAAAQPGRAGLGHGCAVPRAGRG